MIHPTLNTESSPILVEPPHINNSDYDQSDNGYVCLPTFASHMKGYVPMVRLVTEPNPPVVPKNGSYVDMNKLSRQN